MSDQPFHYFISYAHIYKNQAVFGSLTISRSQPVEYSEDFDSMKEFIEQDSHVKQVVILNVTPLIGINRQEEEKSPDEKK